MNNVSDGASRRTTSALSAQVEELVKLAGQAAKSDACSLFLVDASGKALEPAVIIGLPEEYIAGIGKVLIGTQCCGRAVEHNKPWVVSDMLTDPLFADGRAGADKSGSRAAFSVPVIGRKGQVLGSLACHYKRPHTPNNVEIERNELYARMIGFAIDEQGVSAGK